MTFTRLRAVLPLTLFAGTGLIAGCSDDSPAAESSTSPVTASPTDAADEVADTVRQLFLAEAVRNADGFFGLFTDAACRADSGKDCAELQATPDALFGQPAFEIRSMSAPDLEGDAATVDLIGRVQNGLHHTRVSMVRRGDGWAVSKLELDAAADVPLPAGWTVVEATTKEYAFTVDATRLASGVFALRIHNAGGQPHEFVIKRVDTGVPLSAATDGPVPEGIYFIPVAGTPTIPPGGDATLVLAEQLPPGHYFVFDELPASDGKPNLEHGMAAEFTVAASQ